VDREPLFVGRRDLHELRERQAVDALLGERARTGQLRIRLGHAYQRVTRPELVKQRLVAQLGAVVELLEQARLYFFDHGVGVDVGVHGADHGGQAFARAQVGRDRVGDARVLHLHHHVAAV
jgi:hypothetical protein